MYVNLNKALLICPHCQKMNHTRKMAEQLKMIFDKMSIQEEKNVELILKCTNCDKKFLKRVTVEKKGLIYFLEELGR